MATEPRIVLVRSRIGNRVVHPGEILLRQFMEPWRISQNALARRLGVSPRRVNEIVLGRRAITADSAIRLAAAFGTSEHFWVGLQADYELERARERLTRRPHRPGEWDRSLEFADDAWGWNDEPDEAARAARPRLGR